MDIIDILPQLTLEEKASLCSGYYYWHTKSIERLDIPRVMMCDGPHGLRKQTGPEDHLGIHESIKSVCFPSASALAASFNTEVMKELGECLGKECQAENVGMLLGPGVNMKRSPLCGRNFEYFSEDPYLAGELASAYVKSLQAQGVAACVKHFACNDQETERMSIDTEVDERTLHEIYLAAFEKVIKEAKVRGVMCAYNSLNGTFCSENKNLLTDILRDRWGYEGFVVTDWGAVKDRVEGVRAGLDLEMPGGPGAQDQKIVEAVRDGSLDERDLDRIIKRILQFVSDCTEQKREVVKDYEADHKQAAELAGECMVLLENRDDILPLKKETKTVFIGEFAVTPRYQGGGSSHVNPWKVEDAYHAAESAGADVTFVKGYDVKNEKDKKLAAHLIEEAVEAAEKAETAVIFAGLPDEYESEGWDRSSLDLPEVQNRLIEAVAAVQPNTVVVVHAGAPVIMPWRDQAKAILLAYLGGEGVGAAEADVLYGSVNPSGKLAETFPLELEHNPSYLNFPGANGQVKYREGVFIGYRYYDKKKLEVEYPFGYGLSYTSFDYDNIRLDRKEMKDTDVLHVSCRVTNTGNVQGKEIVQLYVEPETDPALEERPVRELKGFTKIDLKPGESREVEFTLDKRAFAYYSKELHDWYVPDGEYRIQIGASSRDLRLEDSVRIENTQTLPVYYTQYITVGRLIRNEKGRQFVLKALMKYMGFSKLEIEEQPDVKECPERIEQTIQATMLGMPLRSMVTYGALREEQLNRFLTEINQESC